MPYTSEVALNGHLAEVFRGNTLCGGTTSASNRRACFSTIRDCVPTS